MRSRQLGRSYKLRLVRPVIFSNAELTKRVVRMSSETIHTISRMFSARCRKRSSLWGKALASSLRRLCRLSVCFLSPRRRDTAQARAVKTAKRRTHNPSRSVNPLHLNAARGKRFADVGRSRRCESPEAKDGLTSRGTRHPTTATLPRRQEDIFMNRFFRGSKTLLDLRR